MPPPPAYRFSRAARVSVEADGVADSIREALAREGYKEEGGTEPRRAGFHVLDGGLERVRALRRAGDATPVILLSGGDAFLPLAAADGVVEPLAIPFTRASLRRAIARVSQND